MSFEPLRRIPNPLPPVRNAAGDVLREAQELARKAPGVVEDALEAGGDLLDIARSGEWYSRLVDPTLDASPLGADTEYTHEATGSLGRFLTNRLSLGEAIALKPDLNAKLGGIALGAGAQIQLKRIEKRDRKTGEPVGGPLDDRGRPPSDLEVRLTVSASVGLGLDLSMKLIKGQDFGVGGDASTLGGRLGGRVRAEAGLQGETTFVFTFDPSDPTDVADLTGLFKATSAGTLEAALPGSKGFLFASGAKELKDDLSAFGSHLSSLEGEVGAYAIASLDGSLGVGAYDRPKAPESDKPRNQDAGKPDAPRSFTGTVVDLITDAISVNLASFKAALGGEFTVGARRDFRSRETTLVLEAEGQALAKAGIIGIGKGTRGDRRYTLEATLDPRGELAGIRVSRVMSKEVFTGIGGTDMLDRVDSSVLARLGKDCLVTVTRELPPDVVAGFTRRWKDDPAGASREILLQVVALAPEDDWRDSRVTAETAEQVQVGLGIAGNHLSLQVRHSQAHTLREA